MKKMYLTPVAESFEVENTSIMAGTNGGTLNPDVENPNSEEEGGAGKQGFEIEFDGE